ncbi:Phage terminase large subunit [Fimbriiglobus ruber]|uniref:Phage terminase large subunit n=1 Tax=Fimbriiglobus ruber TaxID=1908690 RepID=A0A225DEZ1_9BACT|nr:Phage terminase large subunit [Fimbriiglobus ruber]
MGMRFDHERAKFVVDWIEEYCRLYEGDKAGEPLVLLPAWREAFMRLHGWVRFNDEKDCWVRRFTHFAFWAAKKNGKSPCAAAHNLYLLAGDGEMGQKVYQGAKNGEQARIAQQHSVEMVLRSPELMAECKINNSTLQITHLSTSSKLVILTGDDSRGQKAKEGLNGSVTFDEMHVVDREMYERVSRAGISRLQPLICSFSTAGDDPASIGYERYRYGQQVNAGDRDDPAFLHIEHSAPEKIPEHEIETRLDELGAMANPTWGEIVMPSEFRADWARSKGSQREVARFLQYRLNLWVGSTKRWLDKAKWDESAESYTLDDLAGRDCFAALDLSRTRDMTAFVLAFPWPEFGPEVVRLWPMFWLPEQTAKERDHKFPLMSWARAGHLILTPGGVVDYAMVKHDIRHVINRYNLNALSLFFDPHYGEEITQQLQEGEQLGTERVESVFANRVLFKQSLMMFTGPAKEFERRVSAGYVRHPGNPVMDWQVGHCEILTDRNQNIRPVKPETSTGKAVDGVVATVMTFMGVMAGAGEGGQPSISWM